MREIAVGEAQVGDIIVEPIVNDKGRVLLPPGARLSAAVLSRLQGWGVHRLKVEGEEPEGDSADEGEAADESREQALELRFAHWEDDELMMAIKQIARQHLRSRA